MELLGLLGASWHFACKLSRFISKCKVLAKATDVKPSALSLPIFDPQSISKHTEAIASAAQVFNDYEEFPEFPLKMLSQKYSLHILDNSVCLQR